MRGSNLLLLLVVLGVIGVWAAFFYLNRESRMERRRRKSHSRVISKAHGPSVKFSVRLPKK
jgi:Flp pilus assembly protein TadB